MSMYETVEHGKGTPLLMLHGLMGHPRNWRGLFPHLPADCRAIALHMPFFDDDIQLNSVERIRDYVVGYIEQAGFRRLAVCGNSLGGHIALHLAMDIPEKISGIVLTGSSGLFERGFTYRGGPNPPREWIYNKMCEIFFDPAQVTDEMVDEVCNVVATRRWARDLVRIAKSAKRDNLAGRLDTVQCPTLLVWGKQDEITPPEVAVEFSEKIPNATLEWLDRCGHAAMLECPTAFAKTIGPWWAEHISQGAVPTSGKA